MVSPASLITLLDKIFDKKGRARGLRYLGEHKARSGRSERFHVWTSHHWQAIVFVLKQKPKKKGRQLRARDRGKGVRAMQRQTQRWASLSLALGSLGVAPLLRAAFTRP